ncbi:hypothetical protein TWF481_007103 [Arthrobotrys musiformis]|uniref:Uncharacterized protein n=1 Tax=Arthrobotrys musiformis TaxID=47236 RepID=A0AAV9WCS7_9PEZI
MGRASGIKIHAKKEKKEHRRLDSKREFDGHEQTSSSLHFKQLENHANRLAQLRRLGQSPPPPAPTGSTPASDLTGVEQSEPSASKEFRVDYSSLASVGCQNLIINLDTSNVSIDREPRYHYCLSPVSLRSAQFLRAVRVTVDFSAPITITGSLKILSAPETFDAQAYGYNEKDFVEIHPLFDCTPARVLGCDVRKVDRHRGSKDTENFQKMLAVMRGNVALDVTCLYMLPLVKSEDGPDRYSGFEETQELGFEVPPDHQVIVLLTICAQCVQWNTLKVHVYVNFW